MSTTDLPSDLLYHPERDWVRVDGDTATFGVTWYAQNQLGEIVLMAGSAMPPSTAA